MKIVFSIYLYWMKKKMPKASSLYIHEANVLFRFVLQGQEGAYGEPGLPGDPGLQVTLFQILFECFCEVVSTEASLNTSLLFIRGQGDNQAGKVTVVAREDL